MSRQLEDRIDRSTELASALLQDFFRLGIFGIGFLITYSGSKKIEMGCEEMYKKNMVNFFRARIGW